MNERRIVDVLDVVDRSLLSICPTGRDRSVLEDVVSLLFEAARESGVGNIAGAQVLEDSAKLKFFEHFGESGMARWVLLRKLCANVTSVAKSLSFASPEEIDAVIACRNGNFWRQLLYSIAELEHADAIHERERIRDLERRARGRRRTRRIIIFFGLIFSLAFATGEIVWMLKAKSQKAHAIERWNDWNTRPESPLRSRKMAKHRDRIEECSNQIFYSGAMLVAALVISGMAFWAFWSQSHRKA